MDKDKELKSLEKDYARIMEDSSSTVVVSVEWEGKGDYFKKYSTYDNNLSVSSSDSTCSM